MAKAITWPNGCAAAISLSYDDALPAHRELVAPALSRLGMRGTFYVTAGPAVLSHLEEWRAIAAEGHELGNHTIFHPCRKQPGRDWPDDAFDLRKYSLVRLEKELEVANAILKSVDGKSERTYAATCGHITVGEEGNEESIAPLLTKFFPGSRSVASETPMDPLNIQFEYLNYSRADLQTFETLKERVEQAVAAGGWLIFIMHNVGQGDRLVIDEAEHRKLIEYLAGNKNQIWTAPVIDVTVYVRSQRAMPW